MGGGRGGGDRGSQILALEEKKGGGGCAENVLAMLKGVSAKGFEAVLNVNFSHAEEVIKSFHSLTWGGGTKGIACLEGGGKQFQTCNFPIL